MPKIAYFAPDLSDPAVSRRVETFRRGGGEVVVVGFRRSGARRTQVDQAPTVDLGHTQHARFASRIASVLMALVRVPTWGSRLKAQEVIVARNLEMLLLAAVVGWIWAPRAKLVYEVLDVHRLMCSPSIFGQMLRRLEKALMGRTRLLIVSSPAFITHYFKRLQNWDGPWLLLENKVLPSESGKIARPHASRAAGPVWRIGWFGMIRCQRSLDLLCDLVRAMPGLVEVDIRGRPALTEFVRFDAQIAETPGVVFHGPYAPGDLEAHYAKVHFVWTIDFFEAGLNSAWLLPNRLYEGQVYGAVPLALRDVATGEWLAQHDAGVLFGDVEADLHPAFTALSEPIYAGLAAKTQAINLADLVLESGECAEVVRAVTA